MGHRTFTAHGTIPAIGQSGSDSTRMVLEHQYRTRAKGETDEYKERAMKDLTTTIKTYAALALLLVGLAATQAAMAPPAEAESHVAAGTYAAIDARAANT